MTAYQMNIAAVTLAVIALCFAAIAAAVKFGAASAAQASPQPGFVMTSRIPLVMYSTGPYEKPADIPPSLQEARRSWTAHGPVGLRQEWANDKDARAFIALHFPQYLPEFDVLLPGAYRADVWRLLVVYKLGGIYVDCGVHFKGDPTSIRRFWSQLGQADMMFLDDDYDFPGAVFQGVLAAVAGHPLVEAAIAQVIDNIRARMHGSSCLAITGPRAVGRALMAAIPPAAQRHMRKGNWIPGLYTHAQHAIPLPMGTLLVLRQKKWVITGTDGKPILLTKTPEYYRVVYGARRMARYPFAWKERKVYADWKKKAQ
jgi:hypothetical protein